MQKGFFLRLGEGSHSFLLARDDALGIEPRDQLQGNPELPGSHALGWLLNDEKRWPVFRLAELLGVQAGEWTQAVFVEGKNGGLGIAVERVQQLEEPYALDIQPFGPVGCFFGSRSLYRGVCIEGAGSTLVIDRMGLGQLLEAAVGQ